MMTMEHKKLIEVDLSTPHLRFPREMISVSEKIYDSFCLLNEVETIEVEEDNPRYIGRGNCLIDTKTGQLVLGCKNSVIPQDNTVTEIGPLAFNGCQDLHTLEIPSSVRRLGRMAFAYTGLEELDIPPFVTRIGSLCFALNPSLHTLHFYNDVRHLGRAVFGTRGELESANPQRVPLPDLLFNRVIPDVSHAVRASALEAYFNQFDIDYRG